MQKPRKYKRGEYSGFPNIYINGKVATNSNVGYTYKSTEYVGITVWYGDNLKSELSRPFTKEEFQDLMRENYSLTKRIKDVVYENERLKDKRWWKKHEKR